MELDAEGGLGLVGEAGLPGGQEMLGGADSAPPSFGAVDDCRDLKRD